jgi:hypothetical protein
MRWASVIGNDQIYHTQNGDSLSQAGSARQVNCLIPHLSDHFSRNIRLFSRAD